ncbi:MAG: AhpC/TSA family protein [Prevotella sp.]|nr:AhpC/TSA family protein [Prevotella sp.]
MRKVIFLAAFMAAAVSSMAQQVKYSISGTYNDDGKKVYLIDKLTENAIDSFVVASGKFSFKGSAEKDAFLGVKAENQNWSIVFFNDGTPVSVNVNDSTLKGSPLNERMVKYDIELDTPMRNLRAKISKMPQSEIEAHGEEIMTEMNKVLDEQIAFANKVFKEESNSLIPLLFSQLYFYDNGVEEYDELVKKQLPFSNHPYLKKARDEVAEVMKPEEGPKTAFIGQQFTDLEMADPDGKMHKLSDLVGEGKWLLVDFWASWCGPCRQEMPNVLEAYNKFHDKGFEVVGISFDQKKEAWVKAIEQLNMQWLQLSDLKGWNCAAAPTYKIDAIPDNLLIDPQGKIVDRALRGKPLHKRLEKIFGE